MTQLRNTLYITEQDVSLYLEGQSLRVAYADGRGDRIPLLPIENIVCFSYGTATPALLTECARRGIGVSFLSQSGRLRYRIAGPVEGNVLLRKRQYLLSEEKTERLSLASQMVRGKIENAVGLLARFRRNHPEALNMKREQAERFMISCADAVSEVQSDERPRGIEGNAAKRYFQVFDTMLLNDDDALRFHGRSRRPPKDCCNALLSFAYTLLSADCIQALTCAGLDPYAGFFHRDRPGKPSLALDMMEELRPLLADRLVLRMINLRIVTSEMFERTRDGGTYINREGKKIFCANGIG